jgi:hypothetical protein
MILLGVGIVIGLVVAYVLLRVWATSLWHGT